MNFRDLKRQILPNLLDSRVEALFKSPSIVLDILDIQSLIYSKSGMMLSANDIRKSLVRLHRRKLVRKLASDIYASCAKKAVMKTRYARET